MDPIPIWSAGEAGPSESIPGLGSGEAFHFQQGDLALIAPSGDRGTLKYSPRESPGINSSVLGPDTWSSNYHSSLCRGSPSCE